MDTSQISQNEVETNVKALRSLISESDNEVLQAIEKIFDDDVALMFLRCRNYKVKSALDRAQKFAYARKAKYPEFFDKLYPELFTFALDNAKPSVLRNRDSHGRQVIIFRIGCWDPNIVSCDDIIAMILLVGFEMFHNSVTQANGIVIVIDVTGISLQHLKQGTPARIKKFLYLISNASPLKIKGLHILKPPFFANPVLSLFKMLLSQKLRSRFHHHTSLESLHEHISPEISPTWLGGKLSEDEATDHKIIDELYSQERNEYYKKKLDF